MLHNSKGKTLSKQHFWDAGELCSSIKHSNNVEEHSESLKMFSGCY